MKEYIHWPLHLRKCVLCVAFGRYSAACSCCRQAVGSCEFTTYIHLACEELCGIETANRHTFSTELCAITWYNFNIICLVSHYVEQWRFRQIQGVLDTRTSLTAEVKHGSVLTCSFNSCGETRIYMHVYTSAAALYHIWWQQWDLR